MWSALELSAFFQNDERKGKATWGRGREEGEADPGEGMREDSSNRREGEGGV